MRTLTQPELNRALLARQLLLDRVDAPIPAVLERMGGLQAQYAPSIYVGLWSRVRDLERAAVTQALEERAIVQGTLLRRTIHAVSRADYWPFALRLARGAAGRCPARPQPRGHRTRDGRRRPQAARGAGRDDAAPRGDRGARRQAPRGRRRPVGGPRARPALGHVGAPPGRRLRAGRGVAGEAARHDEGRRGQPSRRSLPRRVRPRPPHRGRDLGRPARHGRAARARRHGAAALRRRAGARAPRRAGRAAAAG